MIGDSNFRILILFCALAAQCVPVPAAEPLGRLFFTPDQRANLDTARSKKTRVNLETETTVEKPPAPPAPPAPEVITYGGLVRRSDGKATVWLNNQAINEKDIRSGTTIVGRVRPDGSVTLQSPQSGRRVDLKVGQSAELLSGTVEENYARRGASAKPEPKPELEARPVTKPGAGAIANPPPDREKEARDRHRDVEDTLRALQDAAARAAATPAPPPADTAPAQAGVPQGQPAQAPAR